MEWNQIDDEHVASPCRYHVEVRQGGHARPEDRTSLDRFNPKVVGDLQRENRDSLVVITASYGSRNVAGYDGDEASSEQASPGTPYFLR